MWVIGISGGATRVAVWNKYWMADAGDEFWSATLIAGAAILLVIIRVPAGRVGDIRDARNIRETQPEVVRQVALTFGQTELGTALATMEKAVMLSPCVASRTVCGVRVWVATMGGEWTIELVVDVREGDAVVHQRY